MAAGPTFTPIATYTFTGSSSTFTFSSIPQTYTDLFISAASLGATPNDGSTLAFQFNGDTGTNYSINLMQGSGSAANAAYRQNFSRILTGYNSSFSAPSSYSGAVKFDIMNYSNSTTYKTCLSRFDVVDTTASGPEQAVALWRNTSAITSIKAFEDSGTNFVSGAVITLYGIASA